MAQNPGGTSSTVMNEKIKQNRQTLDGVLRVVPGVSIGNTCGMNDRP